jgi:hypothetical protein
MMEPMTALEQAAFDAVEEAQRAKRKHPKPWNSFHEGFAILYEEFDELKAEVWKSTHDKRAMRTECVQLAAMALRFASELCVEPVAESAQNCGCDMGCKPKPHYCERHQPIEPNLLYQDKAFDDAECEHTKDGYGKCWRPKGHPGSHANAQHLWVESPLCP